MHISQILWAINSANQTLVPIKIVEKVIKETVEGVKTEFIVQTVNGKKINLSTINAPYFENIEDASAYLLNAANNIISRVIAKAQEDAKKFHVTVEQVNEQHKNVVSYVQTPSEQYTIDQVDDSFITLPDGRQAKVRIKLPEEI